MFPVFVTVIVYVITSPALTIGALPFTTSVVIPFDVTDTVVFSTFIPGSAFSGVTSAVSSFPGVTGVVAVAVFFSNC